MKKIAARVPFIGGDAVIVDSFEQLGKFILGPAFNQWVTRPYHDKAAGYLAKDKDYMRLLIEEKLENLAVGTDLGFCLVDAFVVRVP